MDVNRPKLLARIVVCYSVGVLVLATLSHATAATGEFFLLALLAAVFGIPFLVAVLVVAYLFAPSILRRPLVWGIAIPAFVSGVAGLVFMRWEGVEAAIVSTILAAICAFVGSLSFLLWLYMSPLKDGDEHL